MKGYESILDVRAHCRFCGYVCNSSFFFYKCSPQIVLASHTYFDLVWLPLLAITDGQQSNTPSFDTPSAYRKLYFHHTCPLYALFGTESRRSELKRIDVVLPRFPREPARPDGQRAPHLRPHPEHQLPGLRSCDLDLRATRPTGGGGKLGGGDQRSRCQGHQGGEEGGGGADEAPRRRLRFRHLIPRSRPWG